MRKNYVIMMRELREDHDLRQKEVAAYLKIDQRVYSRYETGRNALPIEKQFRCANFIKFPQIIFWGWIR